MDVAIAAFTKNALHFLTNELLAGDWRCPTRCCWFKGVIDNGTLAECIRRELEPHAEKPREEFVEAVRQSYIQLADCLDANEPWERRWR